MALTRKWSAQISSGAPKQSFGLTSSLVPVVLALILALGSGVAAYFLTHSVLPLLFLLVICACLAVWRIGPTASTGIFLLTIPAHWLVVELLHFNGFAYYQVVGAMKDVVLVAAVLWFLSQSHRFRLTIPDFIMGLIVLLILLEQIFYTDIKGVRDDWEWVLAYALGRLLILSPSGQALWAKCAVWMCVVLAILGGWEVLVLGPEYRLLLMKVTEGGTKLDPSYGATGYAGMRAASTTVSPLEFSALCMMAFILWWVYMKNPIPGVLVGTGLILTLTRSAFIAAVVGALVIAVRRREQTRLIIIGAVLFVGLIVAASTLDLEQYLQATFNPQLDVSSVGHKESVQRGYNVMLDNPLGLGAGTVGPRRAAVNPDALNIEDSFINVAIEYGLLGGALTVAFFLACLWSLFKLREPIGYAGFSILLGYSLLTAIGGILFDIPLACWIWVPVGLGVTRAAEASRIPSLQFS